MNNKPEQCSFEQAAETARVAMGGMMREVAKLLDAADIDAREAVMAIAEGALANAVDAYLRFLTVFNVPLKEVRVQLEKSLETYWKQAVAAHLTEIARRKAAPEGDKEFKP